MLCVRSRWTCARVSWADSGQRTRLEAGGKADGKAGEPVRCVKEKQPAGRAAVFWRSAQGFIVDHARVNKVIMGRHRALILYRGMREAGRQAAGLRGAGSVIGPCAGDADGGRIGMLPLCALQTQDGRRPRGCPLRGARPWGRALGLLPNLDPLLSPSSLLTSFSSPEAPSSHPNDTASKMFRPRTLALLFLLSSVLRAAAVRLPPYDELHTEDAIQAMPQHAFQRRSAYAHPTDNDEHPQKDPSAKDHPEANPPPVDGANPPRRKPKVISLPIEYFHGQYQPISVSTSDKQDPDAHAEGGEEREPKHKVYPRSHSMYDHEDGHESDPEDHEEHHKYARDPVVPYLRYHQRPAYTPSIQAGNPHLSARNADSRPEGCPPCRRCEAHSMSTPGRAEEPCECLGGYRPHPDEDCICPDDRPYPISHKTRRSEPPHNQQQPDESLPIFARDPNHHAPSFTPLFGMLHSRDYIPAVDAPFDGEFDAPHAPISRRSADPDPLPKKKKKNGGDAQVDGQDKKKKKKGKDSNPNSYRCTGPRCESLGMKMKMMKKREATNMNAHGGHGQRRDEAKYCTMPAQRTLPRAPTPTRTGTLCARPMKLHTYLGNSYLKNLPSQPGSR
ncbi:hypothetical protein DFH27DRAFT_604450 [Peziza echinospora]|nr:hypothetical protein DFH27DRAFT_604450 [Peziza echinospora]